MSVNPATQPLIDAYLTSVAEIAELDEKLGNVQSTGRLAFNALATANPDMVARAQAWLQTFVFLTDEVEQLVWCHVLSANNKKVNEMVQTYIKANTPEVVEGTVTDDERTVVATARSEQQKLAKSLFGTLQILLKGDEDALAALPDCPEGIRGAIGKRGKMGRKIDSNFHYTINGEDFGVMPLASAAKIAKLKAASIRTFVQEKYPEGTPDFWTVQVGMTVVKAVRDTSAPVEDEDDDDDDDTDD